MSKKLKYFVLICEIVATLAKMEFVEITVSEVIFWKEVPLKFQFHAAIKEHIEPTGGFKSKVVRVPLWRMEQNKTRSMCEFSILFE